jgi:biotin carboxyl carrier protein
VKKFKVSINDEEYEVGVQELPDEPAVARETARRAVAPIQPAAGGTPLFARETGGQVTSPLPGIVTSIMVEAGMTVHKGDALVIIEAMKMENVITSTVDGTVKEIRVAKGESVNAQEILLVIG